MDEDHVVPALLVGDLADRLQIGLALDIAHRTADLADHGVQVLFGHGVDAALDLVGDMGDDLYGAAQVFALPLPVQHVPIDLSGGDGGIGRQRLVGKALVVAEIQIRFRSVVGHEDLSVLIRAHGAGIDVQIGVELLVVHQQSARLQQTGQRRRADPLSQA